MAHESRSHAILSASSSHRWLNCPPSAKLNAERSDTVSEYAKEGTCAHELAEYKLRKALGQSDRELHEITENLDFFDSEMDNCTDSYADFVLEQLENSRKICPDTLILIEQKLDFSEYVPDGFGTGDCVIVADGTLQVIDFKYGLGVLVSAEKNSQMMLYALGSLAIYRDLYDIEKVRMTIFQPRRENVSDWTISVPELLDWAKKLLFMYIAQLIFSKCRFCTKNQVLFRDIPLCFPLKIDFLMAIVQNHEKSCPNCKNKNFLREIKSRTPKKRSFIYIAQLIF